MGTGDKAKNTAQESKGKVKEGVGDATDNTKMEAKGKAEKTGAQAKQAGENVKDAAKDATDR